MTGALSSLKILDFTTLLPGPFGSMMLADLGADIIRIESITRPDLIRILPEYVDGESITHAFVNRSKRSLAIDLKKQEGKEVIKRLVREYDIIMEQFRPGVMDRLGLGYDDLCRINPRVIYCSISGYGQTGPYRDRGGHDINYLSIAGITSYNGRKSSGPAPINLQIADIAGGSYHAVMGILAAEIHRRNTGEGQHIDISLTDTAFSMQVTTAPNQLMAGIEPGLEEMVFNGGTFYDCYETADGRYLSVAGIEPHFFSAFCEVIERPDLKEYALSQDPGVQSMLKKEISEVIKNKSFKEWQTIFSRVDACVEPVLKFSEACEHPQVKSRKLVVDVPSGSRKHRQLASPFKFSKTDPEYKFTGAALGQHSTEVMRQSGYTDDEIEKMIAKDIIMNPERHAN